MLPLVRTIDAIVGLIVVGATLVASALYGGHLNGMAVIVAIVIAWQVAITARKVRHVPDSLLERLQPTPAGPIAPSPDQIAGYRRRIGAVTYFANANRRGTSSSAVPV